jgi:hypothetical protein
MIDVKGLMKAGIGIANAALSQLSYIPNCRYNRINAGFGANPKTLKRARK